MKTTLIATAFAATLLAGCSPEPVKLHSDTLNTGYPFCLTKEALHQLTNADVNNSPTVRARLMSELCSPGFIEGVSYEIIDTTFGMAHVLIETDRGHVEVWTYREAIMEGR